MLPLAVTTFSGINDYDYPALSSPAVGLAGMELVGLVKRVPLPPELVEQFDRILLVHCYCTIVTITVLFLRGQFLMLNQQILVRTV